MTRSDASPLRAATAALIVLGLLTQTACYNTYFIDNDELRKLESTPEPREVVSVYGDCSGSAAPVVDELDPPADEEIAPPIDEQARLARRALLAQAEVPAGEEVASDAVVEGGTEPPDPNAIPERPGCAIVPVSTASTLKVLTSDAGEHRVTPFNFIMSDSQLVSPEYDLLLPLNSVEGAEVKEFSTWKTVATVVTVTAISVGTFVGIGLLSSGEDSQ